MRLVTVDQRDDLTWIAIELTRQGEAKVEDGTLAASLRSDLDVGDDHPVFVPSMVYRTGGRLITLHLMEGYVFVASGLPETQYFSLEKRPYVSQVMSGPGGPHGMRVLSVIPNSNILELQSKLRGLVASDIEIGASVSIHDGRYHGLDGTVLGLADEDAFVYVNLRSIKIIATVPLVFLEAQDPDSP